MINEKSTKIAIIGLGYVGLPLAVEFGKVFETIGFDINKSRIKELLAGNDSTLEVESHGLKEATKLSYTTDAKDIQSCNIFIVTGKHRQKWQHLISVLEDFAIENNCTNMEIIARKGWQRIMEQFDYKQTHVVLEKPIIKTKEK